MHGHFSIIGEPRSRAAPLSLRLWLLAYCQLSGLSFDVHDNKYRFHYSKYVFLKIYLSGTYRKAAWIPVL